MKNKILLLISMVIVFTSCKDQHPEPEKEIAKKTVLIYLAANNNLSIDAYNNIEQIEENFNNKDGNLLVFVKHRDNNRYATLYKIVPNDDNKTAHKELIKEYNNINTSDPNTLSLITKQVQEEFKAESYGLILWSHATGWVPSSTKGIKLRSFGDDAGDKMDITELASALTKNWDFIMFDACSMASIEVLYELKDHSKYIIASPAEVITQGMPYDEIVNDLLATDKDVYKRIAEKYFNHYNNLTGGYRSATISVIEASKLEEIAVATKKTIEAQTPLFEDFHRDQIQRMDFDPGNTLIAFDFLDFIETNYDNSSVEDLKTAVDNALIYTKNTPLFNYEPISKYSGITTYIPHDSNEGYIHDFYRQLKWYKASGYDSLF